MQTQAENISKHNAMHNLSTQRLRQPKQAHLVTPKPRWMQPLAHQVRTFKSNLHRGNSIFFVRCPAAGAQQMSQQRTGVNSPFDYCYYLALRPCFITYPDDEKNTHCGTQQILESGIKKDLFTWTKLLSIMKNSNIIVWVMHYMSFFLLITVFPPTVKLNIIYI